MIDRSPAKTQAKEPEVRIEVSPSTKVHEHPSAQGKNCADYVADSMEMHYKQYKGQQPPKIVKWAGDAALAVVPVNRLYCAIGLTTGLMLAGNAAKIMTGYGLDGKAVEAAKVPTFMNKLFKVVKNYDPKGLDKRTQYIKYAQWAAYSLGGFLGIKAGTAMAYKNVYKKNSDPQNLEDFLSRVAQHQGDTFSWLAGVSGMFGSASGLFTVPVPGINYALSLAGRTTSMQDRNFMIAGMNEYMSGATTTSYLRLREGIHYMCHYAVGNKAETPAQLEFLAYTLLGPLFKDELRPEHIQQFANAVHEVRDAYWQPGGIPKEKRKEALATMKEVFTGAGLEALLINMGLNPGTIKFEKLNGIVGVIGDIGEGKKIAEDQKRYLDLLEKHIAVFEKEGIITHERAQWALEGIMSNRQNKPAPRWVDPTPDPQVLAESQQSVNGPEEVARPGFSEGATVTMGAKGIDNPAESIIKAARKDPQGDWREQALREKQRTRAPAFVVE